MINNKKQSKTTSFGILLIILIAALQINFIFKQSLFNNSGFEYQLNKINDENSPNVSAAIGGTINITSYQLNHTQRYQNETITIEGTLKNNSGLPIKNMIVGVFVNNSFVDGFTNSTNVLGNFLINFRIPYSLTIYDPAEYEIQVNVTEPSEGRILKNNSLFISIVPWGKINLTNLNNTIYKNNNNNTYHKQTIGIEGRLWEAINISN